MKAVRALRLVLVVLLVPLAAGCGRSSHREAHAGDQEKATSAVPPPTPDTTPIEVLRTPAGRALKVTEEKPTTSTPAPVPVAAASSSAR